MIARVVHILMIVGLVCGAGSGASDQPPMQEKAMNEKRHSSQPPYPRSPIIKAMELDWSRHDRLAQGSDNWQLTWADDDHQYAPWGDGGGFGGTNDDGRVSLGVARVEGSWDNYRGFNVWGGKNPENPTDLDAKSWGMVCIDGILYMWVSPESHLDIMQTEARLYQSADHGAMWQPADWSFVRSDYLSMWYNYKGQVRVDVFTGYA